MTWDLVACTVYVVYWQVVDGSVPLAGVLLSLSGSGSYRKNNVTPDSGLMQFTSLVCLFCVRRDMFLQCSLQTDSLCTISSRCIKS